MKSRSLWVDNLRTFIIVMVVAHHAALAYTTYAKFNPAAYIFSIPHPMVDVQRWAGMDYFVYFNDIFFMALMFFISGLFITDSLQKKGSRIFVRERFNRLFVPFLFGVTVLMLIAHYPCYLLAHGDRNILNYMADFFTTEYWPVGPPWFLWVLFLFNIIIARNYDRIKPLLDKLSLILQKYKNKTFRIFILWFLVTWVLYVPMRWVFGPSAWFGIGPFDFQECRPLLYFGYFIAGAAFGNLPAEEGLFSDSFSFLKKWRLWLVACILSFILLLVMDGPLKHLISAGRLNEAGYQVIYCSVYVLSCTTSCLAFLSCFKAFANKAGIVRDAMKPDAFFIYLVHYVFIIWIQYLLLDKQIPAILKFSIVTIAAFSFSWAFSRLVRMSPVLRRYL